MFDASEWNVLRKAAETLDGVEIAGVAIPQMLNLILAGLIAWGIVYRTFLIVRGSYRWVRGSGAQEKEIHEAGEGCVPEGPVMEYTPAMREVLRSLSCSRPSYDQERHRLLCDGLLVCFASEVDEANVIGVLGNPVHHPTDPHGYKGDAVERLLTQEERTLLYDHARHLRNEVRRRDMVEENYRVAHAMRTARLKSELNRDSQRPRVVGPTMVSINGVEVGEVEVPVTWVPEVPPQGSMPLGGLGTLMGVPVTQERKPAPPTQHNGHGAKVVVTGKGKK